MVNTELLIPDPCPRCTPGTVCRTMSCGRLRLKNGVDPKLVRIEQLEERVVFLEGTLQLIRQQADV